MKPPKHIDDANKIFDFCKTNDIDNLSVALEDLATLTDPLDPDKGWDYLREEFGATMLNLATANGGQKIIEFLINPAGPIKVDVNKTISNKTTALSLAKNNPPLMGFLIGAGANIPDHLETEFQQILSDNTDASDGFREGLKFKATRIRASSTERLFNTTQQQPSPN